MVSRPVHMLLDISISEVTAAGSDLVSMCIYNFNFSAHGSPRWIQWEMNIAYPSELYILQYL